MRLLILSIFKMTNVLFFIFREAQTKTTHPWAREMKKKIRKKSDLGPSRDLINSRGICPI